jgi:hypothetical protein
MIVDWAGLGKVLGVGLIAGVGLVGLFALGVRLLATVPAGPGAHAGYRIGAVLCFAVCGLAAIYGIGLLLDK